MNITTHHLTCPTCQAPWECRCGREPCLFDGSVCDDCQLAHLDAESDAAEAAPS